VKKYLTISFWIIAGIYLLVVLGFVLKKQSEEICTSVQVFVQDTLELQFITDNDVLDLLQSGGTRVLNEPFSKLNIADIEKKINKIHYVKRAEVYKKINGQLVVQVEQRIPIIRIINKNDKNFYIDQEGYLMPISKKVTARIIVANGNIDFTPNFDTIINIFDTKFDKNERAKVLRDILVLAKFIHSNKFWNAQIQEIYINENHEIEMVPLVSDQIIILGSIDDYTDKFKNLEAVYRRGFSSKGWNSYKEINLKYKNQVVCVKADPSHE
jgi:cell division protein FtsQ